MVIRVSSPLCRAATGLLFSAMLFRADTVVLSVNQSPVSHAEFVFFLEQERNGTRSPEQLIEKTVEHVTREKIRQQLFHELGLMKTESFADFLARLEQLNQERAQSVSAGRIVYGPVRLTPLQYYGDWMTKLEIEAKVKLAGGRLAMTKKELQTFYKKNQESFRSAEFSDWEIVTIQAESTTRGATPVNIASKTADLVCWRMNRETNTDRICRELGNQAGVSINIERRKSLASEHLDVLSGDENILAALSQLRPGYCLRLESKPGVIQLVRCVSRHAATVRPFEAVADLVQKRRLDQKYHALLEDLTRTAKVEIKPAMSDLIRNE